jgi:signal transduction histidine kinase
MTAGSVLGVLAFAPAREYLVRHHIMTRPLSPSQPNAADMAAFPDMNPAPVVRTDLAGRILLANPAAREGFARDDLEGLDWLSLCPGITPEFWDVVIRGDTRPALEARIGERILALTHRLAPDRNSVFIFGADVTEFRRAEERIEQYSHRMTEMARFPDMNPGPVLRTDQNGSILLANLAALELFGQETLLGRSWTTVCPAVDQAAWTRILASHDIVRVEATIQNRAFVFAHRVDHTGGLVFIYGSDVTLLRAAEEALRNAEKMATLGTLSAGVAHELNNPAAAASRAAEHLRDALIQLDEAFVPLSQVCRAAERMTSLHDLTLAVRDRAERRLNQDALARSDRESTMEAWLEEHEIADPWELAPALVSLDYSPDDLAGLAEMWKGDMPTVVRWMARAQPVYSLVKEIREASGRISEIVKALKTYSFLGQAPVRPINIAEGLDSTLVMLRSKLKVGITVQREFDPALPDVEGHGSELNQVWTNLIDNAADAMGGRGTLTIRTRVDGDAVVVEVEDTGSGIPPEKLRRVFDPFYTTKPVGKGTGLGLATVHSIVVKKHGGNINVASRPGCTRFTVRLPVRLPERSSGESGSLFDPTGEYPGVSVR